MQKSIYVKSLNCRVILARRKGTRSIRLALKSDGTIRLSVPYTVSDRTALKFIEQKIEWISKNHKKPQLLEPNAHIGKSHRLVFEPTHSSEIKTRLRANTIIIKIPSTIEWSSGLVQQKVRIACERALKKEAEHLLPQRLHVLAEKHGISYNAVAVKKLKSRWGSCDSHKNIIFNLYLIQLEWNLIDYVILHELTHTVHQHHQSEFWGLLESFQPDYRHRRRAIKAMPTDIIPTSF
jgi:predicted metal-dependent hydrolase